MIVLNITNAVDSIIRIKWWLSSASLPQARGSKLFLYTRVRSFRATIQLPEFCLELNSRLL